MDDFSPVRTFLPADVDFDAPWLPPKWRDYAKFVVGGLYLRRHLDRSRGDGDFYPLSSKALKDVLPAAAYRDILDALVDGGVVERELNTRGVRATASGTRRRASGLPRRTGTRASERNGSGTTNSSDGCTPCAGGRTTGSGAASTRTCGGCSTGWRSPRVTPTTACP